MIRARRFLSYSYAYRYFLHGMNKQTFYDYIQNKLEQSLEILNEKNEENWMDYIEFDNKGKPYLGEVWNKFKTTLVALKEAMQSHFDKLAECILAGMPEVAEETKEGDKTDYNFSGKNMANESWVCKECGSNNFETG